MIKSRNYLGQKLEFKSNSYSDVILNNNVIIYKRVFGIFITIIPSSIFPNKFDKKDDKRIQDIADQVFDGKL